jgi:CRP-like cAMP-binding protein
MADTTRAALTTIPLFAGLDDEALIGLADHTTPFEAPAGHVLVEVGQPGAGLFVIEAGEVEVEVEVGSWFSGSASSSGVALLTDRTRTGRVRAKTDVRCRALARADLARLLAEQPRIAVHRLPVLAGRPPTAGRRRDLRPPGRRSISRSTRRRRRPMPVGTVRRRGSWIEPAARPPRA